MDDHGLHLHVVLDSVCGTGQDRICIWVPLYIYIRRVGIVPSQLGIRCRRIDRPAVVFLCKDGRASNSLSSGLSLQTTTTSKRLTRLPLGDRMFERSLICRAE